MKFNLYFRFFIKTKINLVIIYFIFPHDKKRKNLELEKNLSHLIYYKKIVESLLLLPTDVSKEVKKIKINYLLYKKIIQR